MNHPFNDGNGRMSRLLTTLLLYRNDFYVGKYISLEAKLPAVEMVKKAAQHKIGKFTKQEIRELCQFY